MSSNSKLKTLFNSSLYFFNLQLKTQNLKLKTLFIYQALFHVFQLKT